MKTKREVCPYCNSRNWSGTVYCKLCSGYIYNKVEERKVNEYTYLLW